MGIHRSKPNKKSIEFVEIGEFDNSSSEPYWVREFAQWIRDILSRPERFKEDEETTIIRKQNKMFITNCWLIENGCRAWAIKFFILLNGRS